MNSAKAKIFTTKIKENAHSLVGILKQYNIDSEVITINGNFEIHTKESVADAARSHNQQTHQKAKDRS